MKNLLICLLSLVILNLSCLQPTTERWTDKKGRKFVVQGVSTDVMDNHQFVIHHTDKGAHRLVATSTRDDYYINHKQLRGADVLTIICTLQDKKRRLKKKYIAITLQKKKKEKKSKKSYN